MIRTKTDRPARKAIQLARLRCGLSVCMEPYALRTDRDPTPSGLGGTETKRKALMRSAARRCVHRVQAQIRGPAIQTFASPSPASRTGALRDRAAARAKGRG